MSYDLSSCHSGQVSFPDTLSVDQANYHEKRPDSIFLDLLLFSAFQI